MTRDELQKMANASVEIACKAAEKAGQDLSDHCCRGWSVAAAISSTILEQALREVTHLGYKDDIQNALLEDFEKE